MNRRIIALIEMVVLFTLAMVLIAIVGTSSAAAWVREVPHRSFLEYVVTILVPLLALLAFRRNLASYGILFGNLRYHLDVGLTGFMPSAVAGLANRFVDDAAWSGALILTATWVAVLIALGLLLRRKPTPAGTMAMAATPLIPLASSPAAEATLGKAISALVFYAFFLGSGEEPLFRGYIQSRLNDTFGRPFTFLGVRWGWGAVIAALLFGVMHVLNLGSLATEHWFQAPCR